MIDEQFIKTKFLSYDKSFNVDLASEQIKQMLSRKSYRFFVEDKPLEPGVLDLLMAAASSASTSGHLQTWSVIALESKEERLSLFDLDNPASRNKTIIAKVDITNKNFVETSSVFLIWIADLHRVDAVLQQQLDAGVITQEHRDQIHGAEYHLKAVIDATIAAQAFATAAESMGLGICYCGAIRQLPMDFMRKQLNLPDYTFPIFGMAVGYPAGPTGTKSRLPIDMVLHRGKYKNIDLEEISKYNVKYQKYFRSEKTYSSQVNNRFVPSWSKSHMGDSLRQMGFDFK